jgi:hypothetical protein
VLSRRYVKSFPAASRGFETETEMTVHALDLNLPFDEVDTDYAERPANSHSKLRTIPDGIRILAFIVLLLKEHRPATFFGVLGGAAAVATLVTRALFYGRFMTLTSHTFAAVSLGVLAVLSVMLLFAGLLLDSMARSRREVKRMMYLRSDGPGAVPMSPDTVTRHTSEISQKRA